MKNMLKRSNIPIIIYILSGLMFVLCVIRGYTTSSKQIQHTTAYESGFSANQSLDTLNYGWILHHEDGTSEEINLPYEVNTDESYVYVTKDVEDRFKDGEIILFDNNRQGMRVLQDGKTVYEVNQTVLVKQLSFTDYQLVTFNKASKMKELKIEINHTIFDYYVIPSISFGSYSSIVNEIVTQDLLTLILLSIFSLFLFADIVIFIFCRYKKINESRVIDLGIFITTVILWGFTDSYLPVIFDIPQETLGIIHYISLMALALPMCNFVWVSCKRKNKILPIVSCLGSINIIMQGILSCLGIIQLQKTFFVSHILIFVVIIAALSSIYKNRKEEKSKEMDILYSGFILLAFTAIVSIGLYWFIGGKAYRISMLLSIIFFSAILFIYVIYHYASMIQDNQIKLSEIKIHERLSLFDALTGLPNRRSFENKLEEIEKNQDSIEDACLIMMDLNGLKKVNDQYGHSAGDDLIVSAARVIEYTYGQTGSCYRIGGDEFVVILTDVSIPMNVYDEALDAEIERVNENCRWKLSIARGISHLQKVTGQRLNISDWKQEADVNMYRNKISMTGGQNRDRANDLREIIKCIISTVEAKDLYTAAHSDRVRELSICIGDMLGISESTIQRLDSAARLHDIGKIGIPDYVLLKPSRLTNEEYEIIKKHSAIGAGIIGQAKGMQEIANIILHHHERWDGKGYPEGLSKEDIPLESRIIAIADSIDAMTSKRVYRESRSLDECRIEVEKNVGIMYDPAIAQIVLQNWNQIVDVVLLHPKRLLD